MRLSKDKGGLGFQNLYAFNKAMLAKQVWQIFQNLNSLVSQTLKCKYFRDGNILSTKVKHSPLFLWKSISASIPLLQEALFWSLGNGQLINIWRYK